MGRTERCGPFFCPLWRRFDAAGDHERGDPRPVRPRPGLSLLECLVALVLLTIGLGGGTMTLLLAVRLERIAAAEDAAVRAAIREVDQFTRVPCPARESSWTWADRSGREARWSVAVDDVGATLHGQVGADRLEVRRRCP